ncbi:MAG: 50S ribosomal protein L4 [candidate division Zixibacteria bacterium]|jgi:large subunit ribosomal protein L4|nr:50S ribosomal protein L4 [candidate division Zixibacteria bacterium]
MNVKVYNQEGAEVGTVELDPNVFGIEPNDDIVHHYIVNYLARQRQGTVDTRTRTDVRGGGRKPWRQKGTGRARSGTIRSPLWRGGGTVFGPHPRSYGSRMPHKMKQLAIRSVFSDKARGERIKVLDKITLDEIKTRNVVGILSKLDLQGKKCVILDEGRNDNLHLSCRNLQSVKYARAALANGYDLLYADFVVITKAGLEKVKEVFG